MNILYVIIPFPILILAIIVVWYKLIEDYKKANPEKKISTIEQQFILFKSTPKEKSTFATTKKVLIILILITIFYGIVSSILISDF